MMDVGLPVKRVDGKPRDQRPGVRVEVELRSLGRDRLALKLRIGEIKRKAVTLLSTVGNETRPLVYVNGVC